MEERFPYVSNNLRKSPQNRTKLQAQNIKSGS